MKREICALLSAAMLFGSGGYVFAEDGAAESGLLVNGDFETELAGSDDWKFSKSGGWYYGSDPGAAEITEAQYHGGASSLVIQQATVGQRVTLEAGKVYRLSAYVKADSATGSPDIGFYNGTAAYPASAENAVAMEDVSATTEWQEVTVELECTTSQDYVICLMTWDDSVNVYFDDVTISETEIPFEGGGVENGDFADTSAWDIEGSGSISGGAFSVSGTDYESRLSQTVEGLENGVYDMTAYVTSSDISGTAYLYAKTEGHTMASTSIPMTETAMRVTVPGVVVDNGSCDIGLYASGSSSITLDNVSLSLSDDTRVQFLKGGEISKLTYVEDQDARFFRADGTEGDALQIMAENGFNLARIRLLDDPGKGHGDGTYYLPEYYMTEEDCLDLARRAKDKGMQICFTFAYSDYWVDGEKQMVPYAWQQEIDEQGLTGEALVEYLENKVYEYTKDVMEKLIAQGTQPEFVSIGNEVQVGILFNRNNHNNGLYNNAGYLARLLASGARAVRDTSPESKIIFHSDNGGNLYRRSTFVSALRSIDDSLYDVIGVSYYPFYNADYSIDTVVNDFTNIISEFDKDVIIMETGYNWSEIRGDDWEGQLQDSGYYQDIYGESQEGQRAFLTELYAKLKQVAGGRCIGDMYWDPVMVYDGGDYTIGWAIRESDDETEGNVVSNSTIFDFEGKAVEGQLAMKYNTNADDNINITGTVMNGDQPAAETKITVNVNGISYTVTTDKFGEYIVSVPYPSSGKFEIGALWCDETYSIDAPHDGLFVYNINFRLPNLTVSAEAVSGGISYSADTEGLYGTFYAAVYDSDGRLAAVKVNEESGVFTGLDPGDYTIKVFSWETGMGPEIDADTAECAVSMN